MQNPSTGIQSTSEIIFDEFNICWSVYHIVLKLVQNNKSDDEPEELTELLEGEGVEILVERVSISRKIFQRDRELSFMFLKYDGSRHFKVILEKGSLKSSHNLWKIIWKSFIKNEKIQRKWILNNKKIQHKCHKTSNVEHFYLLFYEQDCY